MGIDHEYRLRVIFARRSYITMFTVIPRFSDMVVGILTVYGQFLRISGLTDPFSGPNM